MLHAESKYKNMRDVFDSLYTDRIVEMILRMTIESMTISRTRNTVHKNLVVFERLLHYC